MHLDTSKFILGWQLHVVTSILKKFYQFFSYHEWSFFSMEIQENMILYSLQDYSPCLGYKFLPLSMVLSIRYLRFWTFVLMYSRNTLSSNTTSMWSFLATKLEVPSKAYSSLSPLKAIFSSLKKSCYIDLQIWTFEIQLWNSCSIVNLALIPCKN